MNEPGIISRLEQAEAGCKRVEAERESARRCEQEAVDELRQAEARIEDLDKGRPPLGTAHREEWEARLKEIDKRIEAEREAYKLRARIEELEGQVEAIGLAIHTFEYRATKWWRYSLGKREGYEEAARFLRSTQQSESPTGEG